MPGIEFKKLEKLTSAGEIFTYDDEWEKCRVSKVRKLPAFNPQVSINHILTVQDPIIQKLAQEDKADIFTTDVALAALMCAPKAQFAWDVIIKKFAGLLFIDKRDVDNMLDWQTISETA